MTDPGRWQVILSELVRRERVRPRQPERIIRRLPRDLLRRIDQKLIELAIDPRPEGCKKLTGTESLYRLRVRVRAGDWRITYEVEDDRLIVLILEIAPRGGTYRNLP